MRYLGIPLHHRTLTIAEYRPLLQKLQARISNWSTRKLSFEGRRMLINSVLHSVLHFWAGIFSLPTGMGAALDRICRSFLWTGGEDCRGLAKIEWARLCYPR